MRTIILILGLSVAVAGCQQPRDGTYEGQGRFEGMTVAVAPGPDGKPVVSDKAAAPSKAVVTVTKSSENCLTFDVNGWCKLDLGLSRDSLTAKTAKPQKCDFDGEPHEVKASATFTPGNDMTLSVSASAYNAEPRSYKFEGKLAR
ncbi:MAG: hypothetical protein R3B72_48355 [Polyangiaceae bacterium]